MDTPEGRGTVIELDLMRQRVKVRMEDSPETVSVFANTDIAVLRSGKAKKNAPPIPPDLAPISGSGKRLRRQEPEETLVLEPIRFRYSEEALVEEPPAKEEPQEKPAEKSGRFRRRKKSADKAKPAADTAKAADAGKPKNPGNAAPENPGQPKPEGESPDPAKKRRRKPNNRRRKPNPPQEG